MTRTPANLSRVVWLKSSPRNCADSSPFSLSLGDRIQAKSDGQIWKKKFKVWNFQNIIMALWDEVLGPLGTLWTHFWAPGGPGKLLGVSETGILEEFHFWLRKALKWTYVNESMKCYTISESSWHVLFRLTRTSGRSAPLVLVPGFNKECDQHGGMWLGGVWLTLKCVTNIKVCD